MSVRVRFAPSPTGPLHIGGVRTALYNYLFAKKHQGDFLLRIEDTDQNRYVQGAESYIFEALDWLGLVPDESPSSGGEFGPYRQSERASIYERYATQLVDSGHAYLAFDTPEELEQMRLNLKEQGIHSAKYDRSTRAAMRNSLSLSAEQVEQLLSQQVPYTIRLNVPENQEISFTDAIRGEVTFHSGELDDKVLVKAGGLPTYHMANVIDDHLMQITHVIRGEEWLSSTAHHVLLYKAFGWEDEMPAFAHLPLILKPTGKGKLSKRDGAKFGFPVFPMQWDDAGETFLGFKEAGFLPDALLNFLAFLGWNPGTEQEIMTMTELERAFSLEHVTKSGARFDYDKALWFNSQYLQHTSGHDLAKMITPALAAEGYPPGEGQLVRYCELYKERSATLLELTEQARYLFSHPTSYDIVIIRKKWTEEFNVHFNRLADNLQDLDEWQAGAIEDCLKSYISDNELRMGDTFQLLRTAVSGSPKGPDVFAMLELLGRDTVLARIRSCGDQFLRILETTDHG